MATQRKARIPGWSLVLNDALDGHSAGRKKFDFDFGNSFFDYTHQVYACWWEPGEIRFYVDEVHTSAENFWWGCSKPAKSEGGEGGERIVRHELFSELMHRKVARAQRIA